MEKIIKDLRTELIASSDEKTKETSKRFFKEPVNCYGIQSTLVGKIADAFYKQIALEEKQQIFRYCEILWQSGIMEESFVACNWSYKLHKKYEPADFGYFEHWIKNYVSNWASCDTLCNHTVGDFAMMYPEFISKLKEFAFSENRWVKRAAAVTLIIPARKGLFLNDIFEIAGTMLFDKDDMVQKGYGWMLKASSQAHLHEVFDFVMKHKAVMPRTALRYAIEKMPADLKQKAMEK